MLYNNTQSQYRKLSDQNVNETLSIKNQLDIIKENKSQYMFDIYTQISNKYIQKIYLNQWKYQFLYQKLKFKKKNQSKIQNFQKKIKIFKKKF